MAEVVSLSAHDQGRAEREETHELPSVPPKALSDKENLDFLLQLNPLIFILVSVPFFHIHFCHIYSFPYFFGPPVSFCSLFFSFSSTVTNWHFLLDFPWYLSALPSFGLHSIISQESTWYLPSRKVISQALRHKATSIWEEAAEMTDHILQDFICQAKECGCTICWLLSERTIALEQSFTDSWSSGFPFQIDSNRLLARSACLSLLILPAFHRHRKELSIL